MLNSITWTRSNHETLAGVKNPLHAFGKTERGWLVGSTPLLQAHQELDRAVDRCYRPDWFPSDRHRVEYLFALYEKLTVPGAACVEFNAWPRCVPVVHFHAGRRRPTGRQVRTQKRARPAKAAP